MVVLGPTAGAIASMAESRSLLPWPVLRQLTSGDLLGRGKAVRSRSTDEVEPRTTTADRVARSVCPYCAVGGGQRVFVKDEKNALRLGMPATVRLAPPPETASNAAETKP